MTGHSRDTDTPFLTVVIPAGVVGIQALRESLLSLVGQDDDDFDVVLVVDAATRDSSAIEDVVADQPPRLTSRLRVVEADGPSPGSVRNAGLSAARGRYVTVLPEGDLALGRWVRTFHEGEAASDGRILRALGVTQDHTLVDVAGHVAVRAEGTPRSTSPAQFSLWQHALEPCSAAPSWAWPTALVDDHGTRYDVSVVDDPDWELLVRAAQLVGVADLGVVTCLSRHWTGATPVPRPPVMGTTAEELIDNRTLLIPPGEAKRIRIGLAESAAHPGPVDEIARLSEELRLTHDHAANLEAIVQSLERQVQAAEDRHARELTRLRRKLEKTREQTPGADPPATSSPSGRSWRARRRGQGPAT